MNWTRLAGFDLNEEIEQHLQDKYDDLRAAGASHDDARRAALDELEETEETEGTEGTDQHGETKQRRKERRRPSTYKDIFSVGGFVSPLLCVKPFPLSPPFTPGGETMISTLVQDVRYALRMMRKTPGFSAVVVVTLALGIGATTAIFSVLDTVLLRPLPYPDIDRIIAISERTTDGRGMSVSWPNFQDWVVQNQVFEHLGINRGAPVNLTGGDRPERLNGAFASSGVFGAMGVAPIAGRAFSSAEDAVSTERVAVISERLWRNRFNADATLIGRTILLNGQAHTVIGVMPAAMRFPSRLTDVWLPLGLIVPAFPPRGAHPGLFAIGKLKPGVTFQQAVADMDTIAMRLAQQYPDSNKNTRAALVPYYEQVVRNIRPTLRVLVAAVVFVLLIGCANLANLMLSKAEGRHREIAIRAALGAERRRIVQQLLVESVILAGIGGAIGAALASWAVKAFVASQPATVPRVDQLAVDGRILVFTAVVSIVTGVVFGLAPALRASAPDLLTTLKESARGTAAGSRRFRSALVVVEVALAMVLLIGAGLTIRSFNRLMALELGFDPDRVVTMRLNLPASSYPDNERWTNFHRDLLQRVGAISGVEAAGVNSAVPLEGGGSEAPVVAEGAPLPSADRPATPTLFQTTSPDYFRAMGIQRVSGRAFTARDTIGAPPVAIVDETLVRKLFPNGDPVGKRIAFEFSGHGQADRKPVWREIVGVVRHVRHYGLAAEPPFVQLYTPFEQLPQYMMPRGPAMALVVRTTLPPETLAASIRLAIAAIDRDIPIYGLQTMERYVEQNTEQQRLSVVLLGGFGALALVLALVGIYGVLSYTVSQRTQEIGIRIALGATRRDVLGLILRYGMALAAAGIAIGLAASFAVTRSMRALLFEVSPHDPATFALFAVLLAAVAFVACALPGLRAIRVDPIEALRTE